MGYQTLRKPIHVINDDKFIYEITEFRQGDSNEHCLLYNLDLVAGYDYVDPDWSDRQGWVSKEGFTDSVQGDWLTVYPMDETLEERLREEGYKVVDINNYTIHQFKIED